MKFTYTTPDINFPLAHLISEKNKWECGFTSMLFGVRFRIGQVGKSYVEADICCGIDSITRIIVMNYCLEKMEDLDENISPVVINKLFPASKIKPVDNDPEWCEKLNIEVKEKHFINV